MSYLLLVAPSVTVLLAMLVIEWRKRKSDEMAYIAINEQLRARIRQLEAPTDYLAKESE